MARNFSSNAVTATLVAPVSDSATGLTVSTTTGWPSAPFTLILDKDQSTEEVVTATGVSGSNITVTRGEDGTAAVAHDLGATVHHGVSARDFREPALHIDAATGVHGITGDVVGTSDTQTLRGKTFQSAADLTAVLVKAFTGQTARLQTWVSSAGAQLAAITAAGRLESLGADVTGTVVVTGDNAATTPLSVAAAASATAAPVKVTDSAANVLFSVGPDGAVTAGAAALGGDTTVDGALTATGTVTGAAVASGGALSGASLAVTGAAAVGSSMTHRGGIPVPIVAAGSTAVTLTAASMAAVSVSFPAGRFSQAPLVLANVSTAPTGSERFTARTYGTTASGTSVAVYTGDGSSQTSVVTVSWIAVQMTTGSGAG